MWVGHSCPTNPEIQFLPQAFPDHSSGPVLCPRLQLRGSAGFAPASLSSWLEIKQQEDARTCFCESKENVTVVDDMCQQRKRS
jgi:hypothetical protein